MKRIKLILTGGTIGSRIDADGNISPSALPLLLTHCGKSVENIAEFDVLEPLSVLSENMTMADREVLINEILKTDTSMLDGIIIAHGSDTLCYTAALVSMAARHIDIPIVFIASDKVLSDPDSNGPDNFLSAVTIIADGTLKRGCFICYKDINGQNSVYLGTRLCSAEPIFDSFAPFDKARLGYAENGRFVFEEGCFNPSLSEINSARSPIVSDEIKLYDTVLMTSSSPAFDITRVNTDGLSAVINYGYHCGTTDEERMLRFANRCESEGITLYLASFKDENAPVYESLKEILQFSNVKRLYNISPESAYSKAVLAASLGDELLSQNLFFEKIY